MTKIPSFNDKRAAPVARRLRTDSTPRLLHGLVNQLSVINLLAFKLRSRLRHGAAPLDEEIIRSIEAAVSQAGEHAEALQALHEKAKTQDANSSLAKPRPRRGKVAHLKVVRVNAGSADQ